MSKKKTPSSNTGNIGSTSRLLRPIWIYALFACLLVLVCAAVINLVQARANDRLQLQTTSRHLVQTQATSLAHFIEDQNIYLRFLAAQPAVIDALASGNEVALRALETGYKEAYGYPGRLSIVPLSSMGTASLDFPGHRLNSIETAMIIEALRDKPVPAEAYKDEGRSVITLLQTAGDAPDQIVGALLLSLDSRTIGKIMGQLSGEQGQLALRQNIHGEAMTIFQLGEASSSAPLEIASFPGNPNWQLEFRASAQLAAASASATLVPWILLGVTSLLLLLGGLRIYSRLRRQLDSEFAELKEYLELLQEGERALPPALTLSRATEIGAMAFELSQAPAISGKPSSADAAAAAELSEKMSGKTASAVVDENDYVEETGMTDETAGEEPATPELPPIAAGIFRAYDIRGIVGEDLTPDAVYQIGLAIGSEALDQGQHAVIVARDGRHSSEELSSQLTRGLQDSGTDVIDLGQAPTPVLYFATQQLNTASGVMVTGSHNPPEYNGLKVVINGKTLFADGISELKNRIEQNRLRSGSGSYNTTDIDAQYIDYVLGDIAVAQPLKVVIDCGNGIAGPLAPRLFEELGCEVIPLYCDVDGDFPNHHPDPTVAENLADLIGQVREHGADLGIAFDGDGDRLGVVSASGEIVAADRLLMLFAQDVVSRNPGCDVIFDVKCTRHLNDVIASYGGRPIMWKSGHSLIKQKMVETGALLGGEFSGHIFFKERWFGFDDGLYSAARLIEIMSTTNPDLDQLLEQFPKSCSTPEIQLEVGEERKFAIVERFAEKAEFGDARISQIDGVRVDLPDGWGLLRASNTTPRLILRFEAESEQALAGIKQLFQAELLRLEPDLSF